MEQRQAIAHLPPRQLPRLSTDQQAVRAALRAWMQPQATRLAACFWWPTHELRDAQLEMRLHLVGLLRRAKVGVPMSNATRAFADEVLQEAIDAIGDVHEEHCATLNHLAEDARRAGLGERATVEAVTKAARSMQPLPPPWMVRNACRAASVIPRHRARNWRRPVPPSEHPRHA